MAIYDIRPVRALTAVLALVLCAGILEAIDADLLRELERLHEGDGHEEILERIDSELERVTDATETAELLWRRTRAELTLADFGLWRGELSDREAIAMLEGAASHADRATSLAPDLADPYFWKGATVGLRGQIRGILNSLFMASDVRDYAEQTLERDPDHAEAHYMLGQLYRELPRWPLSFGDRERAVDYGRRAIALHEDDYAEGRVGVPYYDFYTQLAASLWRRNAGGDRDEALSLLRSTIADLEALSEPTTRQRMELETAREFLADWT